MVDCFSVAVDAPIQTPLTYLKPQNFEGSLQRGRSVTVPLGKRKVQGVVVESSGPPEDGFKLKEILEADAERPVLPESYMKWLEWVARYYIYPLGQVVSATFPPLKKHSRIKKKQTVVPEVSHSTSPKLTEEQALALDEIRAGQDFKVHLLHGVTGSGKTEVYLNTIQDVIERGQRALVLVPEISLTPQLVQRFSARFPGKVSVIHSHLTEREKTNQWWNVVDKKTPILIGARSALFCPIENLGLIVVDEEHEPSFKQEEKLKYHARDAAIMRAKLDSCPIVLGSATPSLESWQNARSGKYNLIQLKSRVGNRNLPSVEVVDLKDLKVEKKNRAHEVASTDRPFWMSPILHEKLVETLEAGYQAAIFLNRRGMAQMVLCKSCGHNFECPNCSISLTLHGSSHMVCHYCDYSEKLKDTCPACDSVDVEIIGLGTEQVETSLTQMFPDKTIARADRDEISKRSELESLIARMENGDIDILVGTQMIAKGLDFPRLMLVGLALADIGMNMPDFRASERIFQLLTQVSGRAGRHSDDGGRVVIQTYNPNHPGLMASLEADYEGFAAAELQERMAYGYPPFGKLALIKMTAKSYDQAEKLGALVYARASKLKNSQERYQNIQLLGPCPAPLTKIRNTYRYQLLLKAPTESFLPAFCYQFLSDPKKWSPSGTKVQIDVDPLSML